MSRPESPSRPPTPPPGLDWTYLHSVGRRVVRIDYNVRCGSAKALALGLLDARLVGPRYPRDITLRVPWLRLGSEPCLGGPGSRALLGTTSTTRLAETPLAIQGRRSPRVTVMDALGRHAPNGRPPLGVPGIRSLTVLVPHDAVPTLWKRGIAPDLALPALKQTSAFSSETDKGTGPPAGRRTWLHATDSRQRF